MLENSLYYENKNKTTIIFLFILVFFKHIIAVGSFEGETFSQAPEVLVQVRKLVKIAARWRSGLCINNLRAHYNSQFGVSFCFSFHQDPPRRLYTCFNGA